MSRLYSTVTVRYQDVPRTVVRATKCRECGKRMKRQKTFTQTLNPYNRNRKTGQPKTYAEIWKELGEKCAAWQPDDLCGTCSTAAS